MLDRSPQYDEWDPARGRGGRQWERLKDIVCPPGSYCAICGKEIIFEGLPPRHPLGRSVDHIIPISAGGHPTDLANLRPAHYGCNSRRGKGTRDATRPRSRDY